ncbi:unnamed protein product [Mytilus edulis]|uniref:Reverse transcriptase domain-containing protein n=1 Tax=Mytilus edulis TaxID=6550 RepID=A0A8S3U1I7_MYTED|nr:unnamed protein product [Mytilus edulis]
MFHVDCVGEGFLQSALMLVLDYRESFILQKSNTLGSLNSFNIHVPEWEMESGFNPEKVQVRQEPAWVTLESNPASQCLCHDERFLNLWVKDLPFHLETLKDIPRLVQKDALMVTYDGKSGYDHVKLSQHSFTYFGIQFGGFYMTYTTLPFGWKASPFIYQSIGMCVTSYLRKLNVLNTLYIDDRFSVTRGGPLQSSEEKEFEGRSRPVRYLDPLKEEIEYWKILDKWEGSQNGDQNFIIRLTWLQTLQVIDMGHFVNLGDNHLTMGDYWLADDTRPIHEKEAEAILEGIAIFGKIFIRLSG